MAEKIYKTYRELFETTPEWKIPAYQREYSWQGIQIDQLLSDIDNDMSVVMKGDILEPSKTHFLGLLVFVEEEVGGIKKYNVVDGQQRLITIALIAAASRDAIDEFLTQTAIRQDIRDKYIKVKEAFEKCIFSIPRPFGQRFSKVTPNKNDKDLFNILVIQQGPLSEKLVNIETSFGKKCLRRNICVAYNKIYQTVKDKLDATDSRELVNLYIKIDSGLAFVPFVTTNDTDAFNLFETLNDRGLSLSALDLIKNRVLMFGTDNSRQDFETRWNGIFGKDGIISGDSSRAAIRNYLMTRKGHITNDEVYNNCRKMLNNENDSKSFLDSLEIDAALFRDITILSENVNRTVIRYVEDDDAYELMFLLNKSKVRQWQSIALSAYGLFKENKIDKNDLIEILNLLLNICIKYRILNKRFNLIEKDFPRMARLLKMLKVIDNGMSRDITVQDAVANCKSELKSIISATTLDSEIQAALNTGYIFEENDLAYIMLRIVARKQIPHGLGFNATQNLTLEHVLPEKHKSNWGEINDCERKKYSIGNMLLVDLPQNIKLGNKGFDEKKLIYESINVLDFVDSTLSFNNCDQNTWVNTRIIERENALILKIIDVLKL